MTKTIYHRPSKTFLSAVMMVGATVLTGCSANQTLGEAVNDMTQVATQILQPTTTTAQNQPTPNRSGVSQSVDWTPFLRTMQNGCSTPNLDKLPASYRKSIVDIKYEMEDGNGNRYENIKDDVTTEGYDKYTTLYLTNAQAFGYPLASIEKLQGYEWGHLKLRFSDGNLQTLRPQFKLPQMDEYMELQSNDASGYVIDNGYGGESLEFDYANNTITCNY